MVFSCKKETDSNNNGVVSESHIKYFGFTLIDTYWDDPTDNQTKTNYIDEVHSFSNIADILVVDEFDNIVTRMVAMNDLNVKSILHISELFFEATGTASPSGVKYSLRSDYQSRWDNFVNTNELVNNSDLIKAFYIGEEPTWNGISFVELKSATDYVKSTVSNVHTMIIEAYPILDQLQVPNSVDWIGFDHYFVKSPNSDATYLNEFNTLKSKLSTEEQRIVIVMDSHYMDLYHGSNGGIQLSEMKNVANSYYDLAKSDQKVIAVLGYFWPSGFDDPQSIGARNMPQDVKDNYVRIGKEITGL